MPEKVKSEEAREVSIGIGHLEPHQTLHLRSAYTRYASTLRTWRPSSLPGSGCHLTGCPRKRVADALKEGQTTGALPGGQAASLAVNPA